MLPATLGFPVASVLDGWTVPDLINPDDVSIVMKKAAGKA